MRAPFNNPIPRSGIPGFRETSTLISSRDSDTNARIHLKGDDLAFNLTSISDAVRRLQSQFNRLRVRYGGGGGTSTGGFVGEWDSTRAYSPGAIAVITSGSNAGTFGCNIANTGQAPYAGGGYWTQFPIGPSAGLWM
jgi:hypothetical protein